LTMIQIMREVGLKCIGKSGYSGCVCTKTRAILILSMFLRPYVVTYSFTPVFCVRIDPIGQVSYVSLLSKIFLRARIDPGLYNHLRSVMRIVGCKSLLSIPADYQIRRLKDSLRSCHLNRSHGYVVVFPSIRDHTFKSLHLLGWLGINFRRSTL
jgi:hypothetical protein